MESDSCTWVPVLVVACVCCCVCWRSRIVVRSFSGGVPVAGSVGLSVSNFSMTTSLSLVPDESFVTCDSVRPEESLSCFCVTLASVLSVISVLMDDDTLRLAEQPRRPKTRVNSINRFIFCAGFAAGSCPASMKCESNYIPSHRSAGRNRSLRLRSGRITFCFLPGCRR